MSDPCYIAREGKEPLFWEERAVALMLHGDVLFVNSRSYLDEPEHGGKERPETLVLFVGCNDVFAWGCADAEEIAYKDIEPLYRLWRRNKTWGPIKWCCLKRGEQPQRPVARSMKASGCWDADMDGLKSNGYDEYCRKEAAKRATA